MCAAGNADRGFTWSDEETSALLKFWGAKDAMNDSAGNKRNYVVYEKISEKMMGLGFNRSTSQCREKIKRMKREYTLTKQFNGTTTGPKKLMRFYDQFERILVEKQRENQRGTTLRAREYIPAASTESQAANSQPLDFTINSIINRSADGFASDNRPVSNSIDYVPAAEQQPEGGSVSEKDDANPWAPAVVLIEGDEAPSSSFHGSHSSTSAAAPPSGSDEPPPRKKKKIASRMAMFQSMMDAITTKFLEYQESADSKFLSQMEALEKERQTSEENIQKMWMEFEEKRRKEEQDHELQIISTFRDILGQLSANHSSKKT